MTPEQIQDFREFFTRTGRFANVWWAGSMWTWPGDDENQQKLREAMIELEQLGIVRGTPHESGGVLWKAADSKDAPNA